MTVIVPGLSPGKEAAIRERLARRSLLIEQHGKPEAIGLDLALDLIGSPEGIQPDDVWASIYRDDAAADAWLEVNAEHHGHPVLGRFTLPGSGRVVGVLDLRPALARLRTVTGHMGEDQA